MNESKDLELIAYFDYQVLNFGMQGWLFNGCYKYIFDYMDVLENRNSDLDTKVISIFQEVTIIGMELFKYQNMTDIVDVKFFYQQLEIKLKEYEKAYAKIAQLFMNSYDMEDYDSKFNKALCGE